MPFSGPTGICDSNKVEILAIREGLKINGPVLVKGDSRNAMVQVKV